MDITTEDLICNKCRTKCYRSTQTIKRDIQIPSDNTIQSTSASTSTSFPLPKKAAKYTQSSTAYSSVTSLTSSSNANYTLEDIEMSESEDETTNESLSIHIPSTTKTHSHCLICTNVTSGLHKVNESVKMDFFITHGVWISDESKLCGDHFQTDKTIKPDHKELICANSQYSIWKIDELKHLIEKLRVAARKEPQKFFEGIENVRYQECFETTGLRKVEFIDLMNETPSLSTFSYNPTRLLAVYLLRLKNGISLKLIATIFGIESFNTVGRMINIARDCLNRDLVSKHIGLKNLTRNDIINRNTVISKTIFNAHDKPITIWDGTYAYCQKSSNYFIQKKRALVKPFVGITTDGYYLDVWAAHDATSNDATIMVELANTQEFKDFFEEGDVFVFDRGFRDAVPALKKFQVEIPEFLTKKSKQLTWEQANKSRKVTKVRYAVEVAIGKLKSRFRYLDKVIQNSTLKNINTDFRIAAAILNRFFTPILSDVDNLEMISNSIIERENIPNTLNDYVTSNNLDKKRKDFIKIDLCKFNDFPRLTLEELYQITLGTYQLKQSLSYIAQHMSTNADYSFEARKDKDVIRVQMVSRHSSTVKYNIYIRYDKTKLGKDAILGYMCRCKNGLRTLGCCAHVASVLFYLGYGKYHGNLKKPASFLS